MAGMIQFWIFDCRDFSIEHEKIIQIRQPALLLCADNFYSPEITNVSAHLYN